MTRKERGQNSPISDNYRLSEFVKPDDPLMRLSNAIDWLELDRLARDYHSHRGRPESPSRVVIGLMILRYLYDLSERQVLLQFQQNFVYQAFCGFETFQTELPFTRQTLSNWTKRLGDFVGRSLLTNSIKVAKELGILKAEDCEVVSADTTIQPKAVRKPTDGYLYLAAIKKIDKLRRKYFGLPASKLKKTIKTAASAAMDFHRGDKADATNKVKKLKLRLKRAIKAFKSAFEEARPNLTAKEESRIEDSLKVFVSVSRRHRTQKNKIYSIHCPEVKCYASGRWPRRNYHFGSKLALVVSQNKSFILGAECHSSTIYDGHTLGGTIHETEQNTGVQIKFVAVDSNYSSEESEASIRQARFNQGLLDDSGLQSSPEVVHGRLKNKTDQERRLLRRRSRIEAVIGHLKQDHKLGRNRLWGEQGDAANAYLAVAAFNLKKLYNWYNSNQTELEGLKA